jgi:hypothetical protein
MTPCKIVVERLAWLKRAKEAKSENELRALLLELLDACAGCPRDKGGLIGREP